MPRGRDSATSFAIASLIRPIASSSKMPARRSSMHICSTAVAVTWARTPMKSSWSWKRRSSRSDMGHDSFERVPATHKPRRAKGNCPKLNAEARSAAAARLGVGVPHLEMGAAEIVDEIHRAALHQFVGHLVHDQGGAAELGRKVALLRRVGEPEAVGEAGAAAALDREPQYGGLALAQGDRRDARGGGGGERNVEGFGHDDKIGSAPGADKRAQLRVR